MTCDIGGALSYRHSALYTSQVLQVGWPPSQRILTTLISVCRSVSKENPDLEPFPYLFCTTVGAGQTPELPDAMSRGTQGRSASRLAISIRLCIAMRRHGTQTVREVFAPLRETLSGEWKDIAFVAPWATGRDTSVSPLVMRVTLPLLGEKELVPPLRRSSPHCAGAGSPFPGSCGAVILDTDFEPSVLAVDFQLVYKQPLMTASLPCIVHTGESHVSETIRGH